MKTSTVIQNEHQGLRGFWALFAVQFQGAFSDNLFKMLIILYLPVMSGNVDFPITALAFLIFNIPYLVLPGFAGSLSDRLSKKTITVATKYIELGVMALAFSGFWFESTPMTLGALFLMASQSALFSPAKYGILPELLPESKLSWGNGLLQLGTFIAIIAGTAVAGPLLELLGGEIYWTVVVLLGLTMVGLVSSHTMTRPAPANPERAISVNPWNGLGAAFKLFRNDRVLMLTAAGLGFFWFNAVLVSQTIIEFGKATTTSPTGQSLLLAALSLGIGVGSVLAGFLSRGRIETGMVPVGGVGLAILCFILGIGSWGYGETLGLNFGLGAFAGMFSLPLSALLQQRAPKETKGGTIAASNFVNFSAMTVAALLFLGLFNGLGVSPQGIFLIASVFTMITAGFTLLVLRRQFLRFVATTLVRCVYRQQIKNAEAVPEEGGALIVPNHVSFVDALIVMAASDRPVRFLGYKGICDIWWIKPIAWFADVIPVAPRREFAGTDQALAKATEAIQNGEVVAIFAEGGITRTGEMKDFKRGLEYIMRDVDAPIVPMHLGGLWGSIFSYSGNRFFTKLPKRFPYPMTVTYGTPLPGNTKACEVKRAVEALAGDNAREAA